MKDSTCILSKYYAHRFHDMDNGAADDACKKMECIVFVNPVSGSGRALHTYNKSILPALENFGYAPHLFITDKKGAAVEECKKLPHGKYACIFIMGGDGLAHEVFNGLCNNKQFKEFLNIPVGIIPCGSGNALASTLLLDHNRTCSRKELFDVALHTIRAPIEQSMKLVHISSVSFDTYSFLSVAWGMIAEIDIRSERFRKTFGSNRFTVETLISLFRSKKHAGQLYYLPVEAYKKVDENAKKETPPAACGEWDKTKTGSDWLCIDDEFAFIYAVYQPYVTSKICYAPMSTLQDDCIYLTFMLNKDACILNVIKYFLSLEHSKHVSLPFFKVIPVKAFCIVPDSNDIVTMIDGERFEVSSSIFAHVCQRKAKVICPGDIGQDVEH